MMAKNNRVIFCGDLSNNNGPANVNRGICNNSDFYVIDTKQKNKFKIVLLFFKYIIFSDLVIFSSNYRVNRALLFLTKLLRKKTIYIMHGYATFEASFLNMNVKKITKSETSTLEKTDLILTVSEKYMDFFLEKRPEYKHKTYFLTNGIDTDIYKNIKIKKSFIERDNRIIACGANRPNKGNKVVAEAVNSLNAIGTTCSLDIYGHIYDSVEVIENTNNVKLLGLIPQETLFVELTNSKLFILNSIVESFGLSVIDALMCGCSVLVSYNAGINGLLKLEDTDIIYNTNDVNEIKEKIAYNLQHSNSERILKSLDIKHYSCIESAKRLKCIIDCVISNEDYHNIK